MGSLGPQKSLETKITITLKPSNRNCCPWSVGTLRTTTPGNKKRETIFCALISFCRLNTYKWFGRATTFATMWETPELWLPTRRAAQPPPTSDYNMPQTGVVRPGPEIGVNTIAFDIIHTSKLPIRDNHSDLGQGTCDTEPGWFHRWLQKPSSWSDGFHSLDYQQSNRIARTKPAEGWLHIIIIIIVLWCHRKCDDFVFIAVRVN